MPKISWTLKLLNMKLRLSDSFVPRLILFMHLKPKNNIKLFRIGYKTKPNIKTSTRPHRLLTSNSKWWISNQWLSKSWKYSWIQSFKLKAKKSCSNKLTSENYHQIFLQYDTDIYILNIFPTFVYFHRILWF